MIRRRDIQAGMSSFPAVVHIAKGLQIVPTRTRARIPEKDLAIAKTAAILYLHDCGMLARQGGKWGCEYLTKAEANYRHIERAHSFDLAGLAYRINRNEDASLRYTHTIPRPSLSLCRAARSSAQNGIIQMTSILWLAWSRDLIAPKAEVYSSPIISARTRQWDLTDLGVIACESSKWGCLVDYRS